MKKSVIASLIISIAISGIAQNVEIQHGIYKINVIESMITNDQIDSSYVIELEIKPKNIDMISGLNLWFITITRTCFHEAQKFSKQSIPYL